MNTFLNILWHFPFFGFMFALFYALFGLLLCCTVILYPVGMGYFQMAQFLLAPFSSALVTRKDLDLIQHKERSTTATVYSTFITILYFPFGLIAAIAALSLIVGEFLSIIGIPCGIVWLKALRAIFSPIDMVCVPKAVSDEIEHIKGKETVRHYKGETAVTGTDSTEQHFSENKADSLPPQPEVRQYEDEKLREIISNAAMYRPSLVTDCRRELEIRQGSKAFASQAAAMNDVKLNEILSNPQLYAEELIYACTLENTERQLKEQKRQEQEAEKARIERLQQEKAAAERRAATWKKQRPYVLAAIIAVILAGASIGYYCHYKEQERLQMELIAAEEQRIAAERRAEEQRIAEQKRAEEERLAAERKREQQRIAAERLKQEAQKIVNDEKYRRSVGAYLVGEYHEELDGIVFYVDKTYKHGKVLSLKHYVSGSGDWNAAKNWCQSLGKNWRLPTIQEWELIYKQNLMSQMKLLPGWYRSATKWAFSRGGEHWRFHTGRGERYGCPDSYTDIHARAVSEF